MRNVHRRLDTGTRTRDRIERAILVVGLAASIATGVVAYTRYGPYGERGGDDPRVQRYYDRSHRLYLVVFDSDGDGRFDTWSYMDGERLLRSEIDLDEDGTIDRWEEYDENAVLIRAFERAADGTKREVPVPALHNPH